VNKKKQKNFIHWRPALHMESRAVVAGKKGKSLIASFSSEKEEAYPL
jgi:hypothetical protein